jgi:thiol-disulfide isomerase/thioredoxin
MIGPWLLAACGGDVKMDHARAVAEQERAPHVELLSVPALRGRLFAPSSGGRLVNFWATWCEPCIAEFPLLRAYADRHPEVEIVMVSLDLAKLRTSHVEPFVERHDLGRFTHVQLDEPDPAGVLSKVDPAWPNVVPVTLVVDGRGTITQRFDRALTPEDLQ